MNYLAERIGNILRAVRRHGPLGYAGRLAGDLRERAFGRQVSTVFRKDLGEPARVVDAKVPLEVVVGTPAHREALMAFLGRYERPDVIARRLDVDRWTPMLGYVAGRLVALSWFSTRPMYVESLGMALSYEPEAGYIEATRTDDSTRGMGLAPAIRSRICAHLQELGCKSVYVAAGDDNPASQAVARKCGFVPYESVTFSRMLWRRRHRRTLLG